MPSLVPATMKGRWAVEVRFVCSLVLLLTKPASEDDGMGLLGPRNCLETVFKSLVLLQDSGKFTQCIAF